ncbi:jg22438, partial [Pararge aegeria aegeria]
VCEDELSWASAEWAASGLRVCAGNTHQDGAGVRAGGSLAFTERRRVGSSRVKRAEHDEMPLEWAADNTGKREVGLSQCVDDTRNTRRSLARNNT